MNTTDFPVVTVGTKDHFPQAATQSLFAISGAITPTLSFRFSNAHLQPLDTSLACYSNAWGTPTNSPWVAYYLTVATTVNPEVQAWHQFKNLYADWKQRTGRLSVSQDIVADIAYLRIVAMGKKALPFIFAEMKRRRDHWFMALSAISGEDPAPESANGNVKEMTRIWLQWGERRGYC